MSSRGVMRRAALVVALVLGLGGCGASQRDAAADLGVKASVIVARAVVRASGLCDDAAPAPSSGAEVWPRPAVDAATSSDAAADGGGP